jgi:hypothetical protein
MTDPKELRAAAKEHRDHESHHDVPPWVDHILATVRDDDDIPQEDCDVRIDDTVELICRFSGVSVKYRNAWAEIVVGLSNHRPTRGQFRDLCRGLGIDTTP